MPEKWWNKSGIAGLVCRFLFPQINRRFLWRLAVEALLLTLFLVLFRPCFISGSSMEPNYHDRGFTLCFRWRYLFGAPERYDVVAVSYVGRRQLLKRVIAFPGETVEFKSGRILVDGEILDEPYVKLPGDWTLPAVTVRPGHCFVVGDNRSQSHLEHIFGEVDMKRITGGPLF